MYDDVKYWCHYLLWRTSKYSISVLKKDRRGITFIFVDLLNYDTPFKGYYYALFVKKLKRVFGKTPDNRLPILLYHHILFAQFFKFDKYEVYTIDFDILLLITLTQLYGFAGRRCGELLSSSKPLKINQVEIFQTCKYHDKILPCKHLTIIHHDYKNKQFKNDKMYSILGYTDHKYIDPAYFLDIYLQRRKFLNLDCSPNAPLFITKNGNKYTSSKFNNDVITIFRNNIVDIESKKYISTHSLRIGLNVMLESRSLSQGQIQDYVGWSRGDNSSQIGYTRLSRYWKTGIIKFILETQENISGWKRWG